MVGDVLRLTDSYVDGPLNGAPLIALTSGGLTAEKLVVLNASAPGNTELNVHGGIFLMTGGTLNLTGGLLGVSQGASVMAESTQDLVLFLGGTANVATEDGTSIFELFGINTEVDEGSGLTVGTDQPIQLQGGSLLTVHNTTVHTDRIVKIDTALLAATAPLVNLVNSIVHAAPPDATAGVIDLSFRAKVTDTMPILAMDASVLNVASGSLVALGNHTILNVAGNFISLTNGSALNLTATNGFLVHASGLSALNVTGALVAFGGSGNNVIQAQNSAFAETINGIPFSFVNGATSAQVSVTGTPIQNPELGTLNLPNGGSLIQVDGPNSTVTIQGGGGPQS